MVLGFGGEVGVGEDLGGGESCDGGVVGIGEVEEFEEGVLGVVLGDELELLGEEFGSELAVGLVLFGGEDLFGLFLGEMQVGEDVVEGGGGGFQGFEEGVEGGGRRVLSAEF